MAASNGATSNFVIGPVAALTISPRSMLPALPGLGLSAAYRLNENLAIDAAFFHAQSPDSQVQSGGNFQASSYRSVQQANLSLAIEFWRNRSLDLKFLPLGVMAQRESMRSDNFRSVARSFGSWGGLQFEAADRKLTFVATIGASIPANDPTVPELDLMAAVRF